MTATLDKPEQLNFFSAPKPKTTPVPKRKAVKKKAGPKSLGRGEFPPVAPPNLLQENALWLTGQRSIELQRGKRYVPASIKHPGKMQPDVCGAIIDTYTKPGDQIIDCMSGICTTGVEGAERGRHVTCVELVRHWANVGYANAVRTAYRGAPGTMRVIHGDARRLVELLAGVSQNAVLTSPWYGSIFERRDVGQMRKFEDRTDATTQYDAALVSPVYGDSRIRPVPSGEVYVQGSPIKPDQHPPGYDAALMSPPFGPTQTGRGMAITGINGDGRPPVDRGIGVTYDAALLSPPFGPAEGSGTGSSLTVTEPKSGEWTDYQNGKGQSPGWRGYQNRVYSSQNHDGRQADALITSAPYGDVRQDGGAHQFGEGSAMTNYTGEVRLKKGKRDPSNVGNLKYGSMAKALSLVDRLKAGEVIPESEWPGMQYLESMALIDWNCLHVLKPGGLCILVLKDYRREKQRVDLVGDTITIMKAVGFLYHDRALAMTSSIGNEVKIKAVKRMRRKSRVRLEYKVRTFVVAKVSPFVRVNYRKPAKNGGPVLLPAGEEVLVFRKG